jgi:hypothetical protein
VQLNLPLPDGSAVLLTQGNDLMPMKKIVPRRNLTFLLHQICRQENSHRNGRMATPGGRLLILDPLHPAADARELGPSVVGS